MAHLFLCYLLSVAVVVSLRFIRPQPNPINRSRQPKLTAKMAL